MIAMVRLSMVECSVLSGEKTCRLAQKNQRLVIVSYVYLSSNETVFAQISSQFKLSTLEYQSLSQIIFPYLVHAGSLFRAFFF
jgi:hypothetical protein